MSDCTYYAIGDIHGEDERLARLHAHIENDAKFSGGAYKIVHLGDLIDRGPDSRGVINRLMALEAAGAPSVTVKGNHEELMLHAYGKHESIGVYFWAENGGDETIASYRAVNGDTDDWRDAIDKNHIVWLRNLPVTIHDEARKIVFVHGGIDPKVFPNCTDELRMWTRSEKFFNQRHWPKRPELEGLLVVHGHTPTDNFEPHVDARRINVDTGVCYGGPLTAVVLAPGERPRFLHA
ncbi:MAG: metallophosphoesterase family protein [Hyphomonadaceae bacterium]